ncbi:hypothetical protein FH968_19925 [Buttiauxella sp. B2]|uniref:hypothetical protein n=1 Tax=Buttiauxella sp. B2 TaxID=2587812 RepID=UPI0011219A27|nr:hypothetical protein [Buttiauxella sp. B2]TNV16110.1 hypothetical protein FH968_19925 [Buttiauxella sp. B2]
MKKPATLLAVLVLAFFTGSASAEMTGKFLGVWKAKPNANATYTISKDGDNYKLQIQDRNTGTHEYPAVEEKGQLFQVLNGVKRPMFTYVDEQNLKYTTIVGKNIPFLKKQK